MDLIRAQEAVEDILECSICMNSFETIGPRTPKMLPCQHSFCFDCMKSMFVKKKVSCPSCRKIFVTRLHDLPNSLILLQLLDFRKPDKRPNETNCERCQNPREDLKSYCTECIEELINGRPLIQGNNEECKQHTSGPGLDSTNKLLHTESAKQFSHVVQVITVKNLFSVVLVTGICCFMAGVLFYWHYATIFNSIFKILNVFAENTIIFCKLIIRYITEIVNSFVLTVGYIPKAFFKILIFLLFKLFKAFNDILVLPGILVHLPQFLLTVYFVVIGLVSFKMLLTLSYLLTDDEVAHTRIQPHWWYTSVQRRRMNQRTILDLADFFSLFISSIILICVFGAWCSAILFLLEV